MGWEAVVVALVGLVSGGGALRLFKAMSGPGRERAIVRYYREVITDLEKENRALWKRLSLMGRRIQQLEGSISELGGSLPAPPRNSTR